MTVLFELMCEAACGYAMIGSRMKSMDEIGYLEATGEQIRSAGIDNWSDNHLCCSVFEEHGWSISDRNEVRGDGMDYDVLSCEHIIKNGDELWKCTVIVGMHNAGSCIPPDYIYIHHGHSFSCRELLRLER
jgi:hypothetical protein